MPVVYGHSVHSGQTVVFLVYTTGGAFDLSASHSTSIFVSDLAGVCKQWTGLLDWITGLDYWTDL